MKKDIRQISNKELECFLTENNHSKFRMKQINEWLWSKGSSSFDQMSSIPIKLRELLKESFNLTNAEIDKKYKSKDGTIKYSFKLFDNKLIEGVLIPSNKRVTACISSQIGCALSCTFCATGTLQFSRNLTKGEIFDQVFKLNQESIINYGKPITNIVFMGMGEPLLNYKNLLDSIYYITSDVGMGISPKRITVSTAGLTTKIMKLADDNVRFNLAISLHSSIDKIRTEIMPLNKKLNLNSLQESVKYFYEKTKIRVTYEYILFNGINDDLKSAESLALFCKNTPCKVNLIEYNHVDGINYTKSSNKNTSIFISYLEKKNIIVNLRRSKGKDIDAACGQLVNKLN
tara:strand:- start:10393 stop:11427 length:1035 start_codon:yes stop_codon:yes gene_type:complete